MTGTNLRRIVLVDDPTGMTVSTDGGRRPALPGEWYDFAALAEGLSRQTGLPAEVRGDFSTASGPGTGIVIPAALLDRLLAQMPAVARRTAVIDVAREAIEPMLALKGVAAVVETHQYRAWKNGCAARKSSTCWASCGSGARATGSAATHPYSLSAAGFFPA